MPLARGTEIRIDNRRSATAATFLKQQIFIPVFIVPRSIFRRCYVVTTLKECHFIHHKNIAARNHKSKNFSRAYHAGDIHEPLKIFMLKILYCRLLLIILSLI
jgi:hypothetical protein